METFLPAIESFDAECRDIYADYMMSQVSGATEGLSARVKSAWQHMKDIFPKFRKKVNDTADDLDKCEKEVVEIINDASADAPTKDIADITSTKNPISAMKKMQRYFNKLANDPKAIAQLAAISGGGFAAGANFAQVGMQQHMMMQQQQQQMVDQVNRQNDLMNQQINQMTQQMMTQQAIQQANAMAMNAHSMATMGFPVMCSAGLESDNLANASARRSWLTHIREMLDICHATLKDALHISDKIQKASDDLSKQSENAPVGEIVERQTMLSKMMRAISSVCATIAAIPGKIVAMVKRLFHRSTPEAES